MRKLNMVVAAGATMVLAGCAHPVVSAPSPSSARPETPQALYVIDGQLIELQQTPAARTGEPSALYIIDGRLVDSPPK